MTGTCTITSRGPAQWCAERGTFVQYRVTSGLFDGEEFESTEKEFAKHWRCVDGAQFVAVVKP